MPLCCTIGVSIGILTFSKHHFQRVIFLSYSVWNPKTFLLTKMVTWSLSTSECPNQEFHQINSELFQLVELRNTLHLKWLKVLDMEEPSIGGLLAAVFMSSFIKFLPSMMMTEAKCFKKYWMENPFSFKKLVKLWKIWSWDSLRKTQKKEWNLSNKSRAMNFLLKLILRKFSENNTQLNTFQNTQEEKKC